MNDDKINEWMSFTEGDYVDRTQVRPHVLNDDPRNKPPLKAGK